MKSTVVLRAPDGRLLPGTAAVNPAGRPVGRIEEMRQLLAAHQDEIVATLLSLLRSKDQDVQLAAAREMLDRLLGKAPIAVDSTSTKFDYQAMFLGALQAANREPNPKEIEGVTGANEGQPPVSDW
jgi:hypothetical protein